MIMQSTPSGAGLGRSPQVLIERGAAVEVGVEGIGLLPNPIAQG
jgi:hypothetical protein